MDLEVHHRRWIVMEQVLVEYQWMLHLVVVVHWWMHLVAVVQRQTHLVAVVQRQTHLVADLVKLMVWDVLF